MQTIPANQLLAGLTLAEPVTIRAVVTDSRKVEPGCVFVCFPGERVDGHDYAAGAYRSGAEYIVANHPVEGVPADRTVIVPDSGRAMIRMASNYRMLFNPRMIGVTGSVGKTTTKEFCYAVLSAFGKTLKTEGNQNNDIGVPNTLFRLTDDTEYAVVEMGMDHAGEIERLTRCARPSAGIITMIGVSHLENLGTRENILKAKLEICTGLPDGAPLALNADNDLLPTASIPSRLRPVWFGIDAANADVRAVDVVTGANGTTFKIVDTQYGTFDAAIPTAGIHTVYDALAAYAAATRLGLDAARCAAALATYRTTGMRQHIVEKGGITFIEDCYNASPDSMKAALSVLKALPNARKIALLGDMLELGKYSDVSHENVGKYTENKNIDILFTYGAKAKHIAEGAKGFVDEIKSFDDKTELAKALLETLKDGDAVLFKASRGMKLEDVINSLYREWEE